MLNRSRRSYRIANSPKRLSLAKQLLMHLRWRESLGSFGMINRRVRDRGARVAFGDNLYEDAGVVSLFGRDGGGLEYLDERLPSEYVGHHLDLGD